MFRGKAQLISLHVIDLFSDIAKVHPCNEINTGEFDVSTYECIVAAELLLSM